MTPQRRRHLYALIYFTALTLGLTYPVLFVFNTAFIGDPFSDAYEYARHIWYINEALGSGRLPFAQPLLAYPDGLTGAWLWGNPLQSFPAWLLAFVMPLPAAYNTAFLTHLTLNGFSAYVLGWRLTEHRAAALLMGTIFALYPALQGHLIASHVGLLVLWGVPLYTLALWRLRHAARAADVLLAAGALVLCILGNNLLLIYAVLPISALFFVWYWVGRAWGPLARTAGAGVVGGVIALAFIGPVALEQAASPVAAPGGDVRYSADLLAVVAPSFYNPLFTDLTYSRSVLGGVNNIEGTAYIGLFPALLGLVALFRAREARAWLALGISIWVLSLGPLLKIADEAVTVTVGGLQTYIVLPWAALMNLPILESARTPARFNLTVGLVVAVMAAYGLRALLHERGRTTTAIVTAALIALIAFEYQVMWRGGLPHLHTVPYLAAPPLEPDARAVFNIPYNHLLAAKDGMLLQTRHRLPLIAGHVTRQTPVNPAKLAVLQWTLDPALLDAAGADVMILHKQWDDEQGPGPVEVNTRELLGEPAYEDERIAMWPAPEPDAAPTFAGVPGADAVTTRGRDSHAYAPADGWVTLSGTLDGSASLLLNGDTIQSVQGAFAARVPLATGYHTLRIEAGPGCQTIPDPAPACPQRSIRDLAFADWQAVETTPIQFGDAITLTAYETSTDALSLAWGFAHDLPPETVRFVVVVDENGDPVAQVDGVPSGRVETIPLVDLPPGTHAVYVGWYTLPDVTRLPVSGDVPGAESGWARLAEVTVR